jgi:molybdopterin synthase catalytic subunit
MRVLAVVGHSETGKTTLVERFVDHLSHASSVATVKHLTHAPDVDTEGKDTARHRAAGARTTVGVTDAEGWFATGETVPPGAVLRRLAPDHEYAIVEGYTGSRLPKVVLGDREAPGPVLATSTGSERVDLDAVLADLADYPPFETRESVLARLRRTAPDAGAGVIASVSGRLDGDGGVDTVRDGHADRDDDGGREGDTGVDADWTPPLATDAVDAELDDLRAVLHEYDGVVDVVAARQPAYFDGEPAHVHVGLRAVDRERAFRATEVGADRLDDRLSFADAELAADALPTRVDDRGGCDSSPCE